MSRPTAGIVIAGAGIAGASAAYFLSRAGCHDVTVIEREAVPAHHASGRTAACLLELSDDPVMERLLVAGAAFLRDPPPGFRRPLLSPTGVLCLLEPAEVEAVAGRTGQLAALGIEIELLSPDQVRARMPAVTAPGIGGAAWLPRDGRIDVRALIAGYVDGAAAAGVRIACGRAIESVERDAAGVCAVIAGGERIGCRVLVNAAGAWAAELGALAGAAPLSLVPHRRTIATFAAPAGTDASGWPLVAFDARRIYVAPEADHLLVSPMDEEPSVPCDAVPEPPAIAEAFARLAELAAPLAPADGARAVVAARAGLRTFAPDRRPVVGFDSTVPGLFWLAGQGGSGIETSPALGKIAADLIATGRSDWPDLAVLSPGRWL